MRCLQQGLQGSNEFIIQIFWQKAILVSGFSETDRVREAQRLGARAYVKKPYIMERIGVAIRDELSKVKPSNAQG